MLKLHVVLTVGALSLVALACGDSSPRQESAPSAANPAGTASSGTVTRIEGWWETGDSAGPFTAQLRGGDILSVERDLTYGDDGSSRDRFEFDSGRLVRYIQDAELRLIDQEDPTRLVRIVMRVDFDGSGSFVGGEKSIDGERVEIEKADADRVLAQVGPLVEQTQMFAHVYAAGGEPIEYRCPDGEMFSVTYGRDAVVLDLGPGDGRHVLSHRPAASGAKYGGDAYVFWTKGDEAMVDRFGERWLNGCVPQD